MRKFLSLVLISVMTLSVVVGANAITTALPTLRVGESIHFGHYEQDNSLSNGSEPIEWLVLDYDAANKRALLISKYGLDAKRHYVGEYSVTWETNPLRLWLNDSFLKIAFSDEEQNAILMTTVDNSKAQGYKDWSTGGSNNTQDKVFLLSYAEVQQYFSGKNTRKCAPTDYAIAQGAFKSRFQKTMDGEAAGGWWLRSPGVTYSYGARINSEGSLDGNYDNNYADSAIRPALWLNLESGIF